MPHLVREHHRMRPMKHGYTNDTVGDTRTVDKAYRGPDAALRLTCELGMLTVLRGHLPVPPVIAASESTLTLGFVAGAHGQDLIDQGHAAGVLQSCGKLLRRLHDLDLGPLGLGEHTVGQVLVHGDFGPNNVLIDPEDFAVTALLDWEFAHLGDPIQDLAWCEWIVRTHHPDHADALNDFFDAYGGRVPDWPQRQATMIARCLELQRFCERWEPGGRGAQRWAQRADATANWQESV
jgi:aminoglycoside phosphotransferase